MTGMRIWHLLVACALGLTKVTMTVGDLHTSGENMAHRIKRTDSQKSTADEVTEMPLNARFLGAHHCYDTSLLNDWTHCNGCSGASREIYELWACPLSTCRRNNGCRRVVNKDCWLLASGRKALRKRSKTDKHRTRRQTWLRFGTHGSRQVTPLSSVCGPVSWRTGWGGASPCFRTSVGDPRWRGHIWRRPPVWGIWRCDVASRVTRCLLLHSGFWNLRRARVIRFGSLLRPTATG